MDLIPLKGVLLAGVLALWGMTEAHAEAQFESEAIYGADNRLDYYQSPVEIQKLSDSVAVMVRRSDIFVSGLQVAYDTKSLGYKESVCSNDKFAGQPSVGNCTSFLISSTLLVTAGHCVKVQEDCDDATFIFGFNMADENTLPQIRTENTYSCKRVVKQELVKDKGHERDYAIIELDRPVTNRLPLKLASDQVRVGDSVAVMGYPMGLPFKFAGDAKVVSLGANNAFFDADLDTFEGNSGSPVINDRGEVEGILVRGSNDYEDNFNEGYCKQAKVYPAGGLVNGEGAAAAESATSISLVRTALAESGAL